MDKAYILQEIRRTAEENGGIPIGTRKFHKVTGIRESDWQGRYWVRWSEAVAEAGFSPNQRKEAFHEEELFEKFIAFMRELGRYPVRAELEMKKRDDPGFLSYYAFFRRFGSKHQVAVAIRDYCVERKGYDDIVALCEPVINEAAALTNTASSSDNDTEPDIGSVYLLKSGRYYKIGRSNAVGRREYEIALQLPEKPKVVHEIGTDDPVGIEAYWHNRFHSRRKNGEWFELTAADVKAFRRRRFM